MKTTNARLDALPRLFESVGVLYSPARLEHDPALQQAIGYVTALDPFKGMRVIEEACELLGDSEDQLALTNALGGGEFKGKPLAERRKLFAQAEGIAERSVYRREARATEPFLHHVRVLAAKAHESGVKDTQLWDVLVDTFTRVAKDDPELLAELTSEGAKVMGERKL